MTELAARGRPQVSSREMLQDAAFELFLENSYAKTTIEQITQRAGVSRATFFNYFPTKSDVFWVELDQALISLAAGLRSTEAATQPLAAVLDVLLAVGSEFGPHRVPFALTQHELIGSIHELQASALTRFTNQAKVIAGYLSSRGLTPIAAQSASYACLAAAVAGVQAWAAAGTSRGALQPYLRSAIEPMLLGFNSCFDNGSTASGATP